MYELNGHKVEEQPSLETLRVRARREYGCECADCCEKLYREIQEKQDVK